MFVLVAGSPIFAGPAESGRSRLAGWDQFRLRMRGCFINHGGCGGKLICEFATGTFGVPLVFLMGVDSESNDFTATLFFLASLWCSSIQLSVGSASYP